MDDRSCGAGGRAGEYRRLSEGEIPESVSSVSLSAAVPFVIGNMETSRSAGYLFSQIRGVARAFAGSSGVPGGEAVSRLCVETDDFEDRSRMKRFGGQVAIGSHSDTRLFPRQEKPADIVPEEMAVISFGSQLHARRPGVVRFPTETGRPAVRWPLCVWQGAIISKGLLQAGPSICRAAVPVMAIPIFCR